MAGSASVGSVATVASLVGQAWAKSAEGKLRPLAVGDTVAANEAVVTARGAQVELDFGDGRPVHLGGGQEVVLNLSLWHDASPDQTESHRQDAALQQSTVAKALKVLNGQGDLLDNLDETAAGGATNHGHSFVQLTRVIERLDPAAFGFPGASLSVTAAEDFAGQTYINRPPVVEAQTFGGDEDTLITGKIVATDLENDPLTYAVVTQAANGSVSINPVTGDFTYTPVANYNGADGFVVIVTDTHGNQTTGAVSFVINAVNDVPVTQNQTLTTLEDTPLTGTVTATDVEGDTLAYSISTNASHGVVTVNAATGAFVYTPAANYNGADSFVVTVDDGHGGKTTSTISVGITAVNDAPVTANQSVTTNEDLAYTSKIIATDVDGDILAYSVSTNALHGVAVIDAATGVYIYTPNPNYFGADSFIVTVNDGKGGTTTSTVTVAVTAVNDAPVATNLSLTTPEDTPLTSKIIATDVDADTLSYSITTAAMHGTVALNAATGNFVYTPNNFYNGADGFVVTVNDGNGGTTTSTVNLNVLSVNNAPTTTNQILTTAEDTPLVGTVSATDSDGDTLSYAISTAAAHGAVILNAATGAFTYTPSANYNGNDSFVVTVSDGNGGAITSTISIGVTPVNDAPTATNQTLSTPEDTVLNGNIVASDLDADALTYSVSTAATHGVINVDANSGAFVYTPAANYNGADSFVVTVNDGHGGTTTSTVSVNVTPVNDAPTATNQILSVAEDAVLNGNIVASDLDADTLTYSVSTAATHGVVNVDAGTGAFVYTPATNYTGNDSFVVTVSDGKGGTSTSTISIGVTPVNDAPVTANQNLSTAEDIALVGNIVATDADGDALTYSVSTAPAHGAVVFDLVDPTKFTYTPAANYNGADSFIVTVNDGHGGTTTSTISVNVTAANDAPVTADQTLSTAEDTALVGNIVATDVDGDALTYSVSTAPAHGSVVFDLVDPTKFTYTPAANYNGADSFIVTVNDGHGGTTTSTISVNVTAVNDAPVTADQTLSTAEDTALVGNIVATDADGDALTYSVSTAPAHGSVVFDLVDPTKFTYTPAANYNGADSFIVTVNDGHGGTTTSTISVNVTAANDAPVTADQTLSTAEDTALVGNIVATDVDGDTLTYSISTAPTHGAVVFDLVDPTKFTYTPAANYNGNDSFVVTVNDGNGGTTTSTISVNVTAVNDAPVAVTESIAVNEGGTSAVLVGGATSLLANDTDAENNPLTAVLVTGPANGNLILNADGTFSYTHNGSETTTDSFTYRANDGTANGNTVTVNINVTPVNDAPVAVTESIAVNEGGTATVLVGGATSLLANDTDAENNPLTALLVTGPANGNLILNADGTFSYTHNGSETTTDSFTYRANDGTANGNTVTVNINVTPVNDAPVAVTESIAVNEGGTATVLVGGATSLLANDTDAENNPLTAVLVTGPANGSLTLNADGTFSYTHNGSETTTDSFTYRANDGTANGNTVTVNINVTPVNDAPVAVTESIAVNEGGTATVLVGGATSLLANDTDAENNPLTAVLVTGPANGNLILNADGTFSYTHNGSETTTDSFTYRANDGTAYGNTVTVNINVTPVNDAPVNTVPSSIAIVEDTTTVLSGISVADSDAGTTGFALSLTVTSGVLNGVSTPDVSVVGSGTNQLTLWGSVADINSFIANSGLSYSPLLNYSGTDLLTVKSTDFGHPGLGDSFNIYSSVNLVISPVADSPAFNPSVDTNTGTTSITVTIPTGDGLTADYFQAAANVDRTVALNPDNVESAIELLTPTSTSITTQIDYPVIKEDDGYHIQGFVYLEGGHTYQLQGSRDDTLLVKIGGTTVYDIGYNAWGDLYAGQSDTGPQAISPQVLTISQSGYYSLEVVIYNGDGLGDLSLGLSVDAGPTQSLNTSNFRLYSTDSAILSSGSALSFVSVNDGGYYPLKAASANFTYFNVNINAALTDTDGSETLAVNIAGVPAGLTLTDGQNIFVGSAGSTSVDVTAWDMQHITAIPATGQNASINLTVTATATETLGGAQATQTQNITLDASQNGTSNSVGSAAGETLSGTAGANSLFGLNGDDNLVGNGGGDLLVGGKGSDTLTGAAGADTFAWQLGDQGSVGAPFVDQINNFTTGAGGDVLNISDLLQGENSGNLTNYLHFQSDGTNTTVSISTTGGFSGGFNASTTDQTIVLNGVDLSGGDAAIINLLKTNSNLITD